MALIALEVYHGWYLEIVTTYASDSVRTCRLCDLIGSSQSVNFQVSMSLLPLSTNHDSVRRC